MFLEAQFGPTITPLLQPKLKLALKPKPKPTFASSLTTTITAAPQPTETIKPDPASPSSPTPEPTTTNNDDADNEDEEHDLAALEAEELGRLHAIGIPVPGVAIRVDKHVAKVWLETLEVECEYGVLRDRVRAVVERAVETVAPLWGRKW